MPESSEPSLPSFDELFVVSDLHLGGDEGFQIFKESERLGSFCEALAAHEPHKRVGLVLAGDILDSLPFLPPGTYLAPDPAALVHRIARLFAPVFDGLRRFVGKPRRELWILTGNHDVELALPEGQDALLELLCASEAARGRVRFRVNGTGLRCRVGERTVLVTHGNEADSWNQVDYESLRQVAHARALGQIDAQDHFRANPGTRLVIDAMNAVKRDHPFVDLLKPETEACLKVLMALYPGELVGRIPSGARAFAAKWRQPPFVLGAETARTPDAAPDVLSEALGRLARPARADAEDLERRVDRYHADDVDPLTLVSDEGATLGLGGFFADQATGASRAVALRDALISWLGDERHWRFDDRDEVCREVLDHVGPGVDVVVTGHTHLARHFVEPGRLVYVNTGTWARLIRLCVADLNRAAEPELETLLRALESRDMATLDTSQFGGTGALAQTRSHAAHVTSELAELLLVADGGAWKVEQDDDGNTLSAFFASLA